MSDGRTWFFLSCSIVGLVASLGLPGYEWLVALNATCFGFWFNELTQP